MLNVITVTLRPGDDTRDADADAVPVAAEAVTAVSAATMISAHLSHARDTPHLRIAQKVNANPQRSEGG
ncbi:MULTISPECIES: hypothetical protein [unclassified Streptomyces]|uniref:hypothetical protein n=1 Tax=unclassified Streptomyces TaxID=2593676 RepID=UPI001F28DBE1|nr:MULTISPECIES: hypothetical protein [unclassified Streptomyces]